MDNFPELFLARVPEGTATGTNNNLLQHGVIARKQHRFVNVRLGVHEPVGPQD